MSREIEEAIEREIAQWAGAKVTIERGKGHPKAKLEFGGLIMRRTFAGTPSDKRSLLNVIADVRRSLRSMGAQRGAQEDAKADEEEAERVYRKPNDGREKRPDPVDGEKAALKPTMGEQLVAKLPSFVAGAAREFGPIEDFAEIRPTEEERAARVKEFEAQVAAIADGIYFGLPEAVYHAVPRLSASGLQRLAVSPGTFWKGSWLDPNRPEVDEDETKARILGRAYHVARLEPNRFESCYARKLSKSDFPARGTVWNGTEIGEALAEYGEAKKRVGESVVDQARRLEDCGFDHAIFPLEEARWKEGLNGRIPIEARFYDEIVSDMERLRGSEEIAELLSGGEAEVSIFYTDRNGIQMKSRTDYLKVDSWADFKTFDNTRGKELEQALADAVRYNRYHVQAVSYRDAVEAIRTGGLQIIGEATDAQRALIAAIQIRPGELACWYIFQEKNGVPNLLAREFPFFAVPSDQALWEPGATEEQIEAGRNAVRTRTGLHIRAMGDIDRAKRAFVLYSQVYDPGRPWAPLNPRRSFEDADFNRYWLEGN